MDETQIMQFEAELTALGFMVENLFAVVALSHGANQENFERTRADMLRQFSLPATSSTGPAPANDTAMRDLAAKLIDARLAAVADRLRTAQAPAPQRS